jgi:CHAD domain-containing protein
MGRLWQINPVFCSLHPQLIRKTQFSLPQIETVGGLETREVTMSAVHPIEVLEKRLRDLLELFESDLSDAVDQVTEKFSGKVERLIELFGAEELEINLKYYPITVLPKNLHQAFGPVSALRWQDEE